MIQLYVSKASPYSSKIRALMGFSGLPHDVVIQDLVSRYAVLKRLTGKTLVPTLRHGDFAITDSTAIARHLLAKSTRPLLNTDEPVISWLIDDFTDEWMVRWMVQPRWADPQNVAHVTHIIGTELAPKPMQGPAGRFAAAIVQSQLRKSGLLDTCPALAASRDRTLVILEALFAKEPYIFGGAPTVPDFALYGMLWQFFTDPTGTSLQPAFPNLWAFCERVHGWTKGQGETSPQSRDITELQPLVAEILSTHWAVLVDNLQHEAGTHRVVLTDGLPMTYVRSSWLRTCASALLDEAERALETSGRLSRDPEVHRGLMRAFVATGDVVPELLEVRPNLKKSKTAPSV